MERKDFLPVNKNDMKNLGWDYVDFVLISGDAYIDHPSFGTALIGRTLTAEGYRVGIIAQPKWHDTHDFMRLGKPKIAFLIAGGNIDSMVNHYTASKKHRKKDLYSPGGEGGHRPDRATIVYSQRVKEAYKDVPLIIGGIEASLRRFAHYDYWDNKVRRSILFDSKADLLVFGMGEKQIKYIADALSQGTPINKLRNIQGTCYISNELPKHEYVVSPSFEAVKEDKKEYAKAFAIQNKEQNPHIGKTVVQAHGNRYLVQLPPVKPMTQKELDEIHDYPFTRTYHPMYEKMGGVPALKEVEFSITAQRGCFGGCSFCALNFHQGRIIQGRSQKSILDEAKRLTESPNFKGYIHDVGGPTANFRKPACKYQAKRGACSDRQCLFPDPCKNLEIDHTEYIDLLRKVRSLPNIKKVFVRSGVRYDYVAHDKNDLFLEELCKHHVSGQLKVAPEHVSAKTLSYMGKPKREVYDKFVGKYNRINKKLGKKQYLVPYFIASHPGCTLKDAIELAEYVRDMGYNPEQVQDFIPTPGSLSTAMYYSGYDPRTMKKVYVPRSVKERAMQRALLQYRNPKNYQLVYEALIKADRKDLIGYGPQALIRPPKDKEKKTNNFKHGKKNLKNKKSVRSKR